MLYTIPDYYREFHCTAGECEDTCCAGWEIEADSKSMCRYAKEQGPFRDVLRKSINWRKSTFKHDHSLRCAFLNDENLCDMYTALGSDSLCKTCRLYPRHIEEFEGVREMTLSLSCPEVARILMARQQPVAFESTKKGGQERYEYDEFDPLIYSQLADAREVMLQILQQRTLPLAVRTKLMLGIAHDIQIRVDRNDIFSCGEVLEKYQKSEAKVFVRQDLAQIKPEDYYVFVRKMFAGLEQMELLRPDWKVLRTEARQRLYGEQSIGLKIKDKLSGKNQRRPQKKELENWNRISEAFLAWTEEHDFPWEVQKEQLLVYYISVYFCGAVYNGNIYAKARMAAVNVLLIEELMKSRWLRNEKNLDLEDAAEIVYRFSREIEHSDNNRIHMEELSVKR